MKNKLTAIMLAGLLAFSLTETVWATDNHSARSTSILTSTSQVTPRAEQTEWHYRMYNGHAQKRLWSITEGKWLTDWIDVKL